MVMMHVISTYKKSSGKGAIKAELKLNASMPQYARNQA
jgi:hypothetical protein